MAFIRRNFAVLNMGRVGAGSRTFADEQLDNSIEQILRFCAYKTEDDVAAVTTAGYFAEIGHASGDGTLNEGDLIYTLLDIGGTRTAAFLVVSDEDTGTAVQLEAGAAGVEIGY